jgi:hypothetical protein
MWQRGTCLTGNVLPPRPRPDDPPPSPWLQAAPPLAPESRVALAQVGSTIGATLAKAAAVLLAEAQG